MRLQIPLQPTDPKPAVIALLGDVHRLLDAGFVAASYTVRANRGATARPTPAPGATAVGKWVLASPSEAVLGEQYLRDISATADAYVPMVVDWLAAQPEVDATRLGMVGGSTNGFVALRAGAVEPRLRVIVAVAACADYERFLQGSSMGMNGAPLHLGADYATWLRGQEVIRDPGAITHAALLMVNRDGDPLIPIACADETARILAAAYARADASDRFSFLRLQGEGHGFGEAESAAAMAWLEKWL